MPPRCAPLPSRNPPSCDYTTSLVVDADRRGRLVRTDPVRRTTGALLVLGALSFAVAATVLSAAFDWPDVLREPADVVLPAFEDGGARLIWIWFATAWTYGLLAVPVLLLPAALGRRDDPVLRVATVIGATLT